MLNTDFLYQPHGPGTGWCFRMRTPDALLGYVNPCTGKPYGKEIRAGLGTRDLREARDKRDILLGQIKAEAAKVVAEREGDPETAIAHAQSLRAITDPETQEAVEAHLHGQAEKIASKAGEEKARRWYRTATGNATPVSLVYDKYLADAGKALTQSTLVNLKTAWNDFQAFAGKGVTVEAVDRRMVAEFVTEYLPAQTMPRTPNGPGPATIRKKVSLLGQVWQWAMQRGFIPFEAMSPWDKQAPSKKAIKAAAKKTRIYTPEEVCKLFEAIPAGTREGDVIRIALLAGVRLSEITQIEASWVDEDCGGYTVPSGKTDNAARYVPLERVDIQDSHGLENLIQAPFREGDLNEPGPSDFARSPVGADCAASARQGRRSRTDWG